MVDEEELVPVGPVIWDGAYAVRLFVRADDRTRWRVRVTDGGRHVDRDLRLDPGTGSPAAVVVDRAVASIADAVGYGKLELAGIRHLVHAADPWAEMDDAALAALRDVWITRHEG